MAFSSRQRTAVLVVLGALGLSAYLNLYSNESDAYCAALLDCQKIGDLDCIKNLTESFNLSCESSIYEPTTTEKDSKPTSRLTTSTTKPTTTLIVLTSEKKQDKRAGKVFERLNYSNVELSVQNLSSCNPYCVFEIYVNPGQAAARPSVRVETDLPFDYRLQDSTGKLLEGRNFTVAAGENKYLLNFSLTRPLPNNKFTVRYIVNEKYVLESDPYVESSITHVSPSPTPGQVLAPGSAVIINFSTTMTGSSYVLHDLNRDLVGWFRFEDNYNDDSTYGNAMTSGVYDDCAYTAGKFGQSVSQLAGTGCAACTNAANDDMYDIMGPYTISVWWYPLSTTESSIIAKDYYTSGYMLWWAGSTVRTYITGGNWIATGTLDVNRWYFITTTWNGSTYLMYVNSTLVGTGGNALPVNSEHQLCVSGYYRQAMYVDELMFFNRSLSAVEVQSLYDATNRYTQSFSGMPNGFYNTTGWVVNTSADYGISSRVFSIGGGSSSSSSSSSSTEESSLATSSSEASSSISSSSSTSDASSSTSSSAASSSSSSSSINVNTSEVVSSSSSSSSSSSIPPALLIVIQNPTLPGDVFSNWSMMFNVTVNVTCINKNCGSVNVTLDPMGVCAWP